MIIKEASKKDAVKLAKFYQDVFPYDGSLKANNDPYPCIELFSEEGQEELIQEMDVFYAEESGNILGCVMVEHIGKHQREIINLFVHQDTRKKGIGESLVEKVRQQYQSISHILFDKTEIVTHTTASQKIHQKIGFSNITGVCLYKYGKVFLEDYRESTVLTHTTWGGWTINLKTTFMIAFCH